MIPLITDFDKERNAIINPSEIVESVEEMPKYIISCFTRSIIEKLASRDDVEVVWVNETANGGYPVYKTKYNGVEIGFFMSGIGAALSASMLEEMIAIGAEKFLYFGSCGVLSNQIEDGEVIVPKYAIRDEGTSYHYLPASERVEMDDHAYQTICSILDEMNVPHCTGGTWTTDAFYRETQKKMKKRIKQGCLCVEMECSALLAVSKFREVSFGQFLFAADCLDETVWQQRGLHVDQGLTLSDLYIEIAMKSVLKL
ncbi:uridine phosphorylase [Breznakia sp. PF5-3]|uniref:nucleoside phosphorylase n=1 Tax=unclassified Breznakia TaxID=2623764 RepID=UPI002406F057|nr:MULTISPECIES: nucleoside phosphorylase [unclassified Breznakia]MDF9824791.1 uridine phosphorylase [Breznakia sp. PM6-1]MDF9835753.1 uridine phosphorylase [Breznakia sp. PF5-3]MDF9837839.1 uridine phosphorylase [Breznakia sp. PFB2-8]MDF9859790.1 uridine phosphorylase [Breznakia sp. PH5-24]